MKFVYFGSSKFSRYILEGLCGQNFIPTCVVTKPDKPKGRGLKSSPTEVSSLAAEKSINCLKPGSLNNGLLRSDLKKEEADFFIVADYGKLIPEDIISLPKEFTLCVHPSYLPYYRGATPIEQAIINGDNYTGISIFKVNGQIDSGDIITQKKVPVGSNDFFSLRDILAQEGIKLLIDSIKKIQSGNYKLTPQDNSKATFTYKLKKSDGVIDWNKPAKYIKNFVRGILEWPTAYTYYKSLMIKVLEIEAVSADTEEIPGTILKIDKKGIYVACSSGLVRITKLRPQGKPDMGAFAFVCGHKIKIGERLG